MKRVLVLGGTREAQQISAGLQALGMTVTLALKGLTRAPKVPEGVTLRSGGFGGSAGLAAYLADSQTELLIDATHPFATGMSWNAYGAAQLSGVPLYQILRPGWARQPGDRWRTLGSLAKAAMLLRSAPPQRVMLALGGQGAEQFRACPQHRFQARVLRTSRTALATSAAHRWRGLEVVPMDQAPGLGDELAGMRRFAPDLMIVRNAGGAMSAKLAAARRLHLPIWMIARPQMPAVPRFASPAALLAYLVAGDGGTDAP